MIKQSAAMALTLSLCLVACNRSGSGNASKAAVSTNNSSAPAPAQTNSSNSAAAKAEHVGLALDSEGLRAVEGESGRTSLLAFGSPVDQAIDGLNRIFGARPTQDGTNRECGAGPTRIVQWANGFSVLAQDGRFAGWETDQPGQTTMNGIGVGSTRAQLDEAFHPRVEQDTIGLGFGIGEGENAMGGYLSGDGPTGRVTSIYAGLTCHFG